MMSSQLFAIGCDTFVALPPATAKPGTVIFGKNSDRPSEEVQEIVYCSGKSYEKGAEVQCTYISIPQVEKTYSVILSKPSWMWGAEMGANEKGVVIGNEAVWTTLLDGQDEKVERLLGMDLLRLGLERGATAEESLAVITTLLETHGQGGPCSEDMPGMVYHNSFLIADRKETWILETARKHWVAQRITEGLRNISNNLTITNDYHKSSEGLSEFAMSEFGFTGVKDGSVFDFGRSLSSSGDVCDESRQVNGRRLLQKFKEGKTSIRETISAFSGGREQRLSPCLLTQILNVSPAGELGAKEMMTILRDQPSGICMGMGGGFTSTSSQVSILSENGCAHFFTGTPDPSLSIFKPFFFAENQPNDLPLLRSPAVENDPAKVSPRFARTVDRAHPLYKKHQSAFVGKSRRSDAVKSLIDVQLKKEQEWIKIAEDHLFSGKIVDNLPTLFNDCAGSENQIYADC